MQKFGGVNLRISMFLYSFLFGLSACVTVVSHAKARFVTQTISDVFSYVLKKNMLIM